MAENYPTPTTPLELPVPPEGGELLRVTFWHATSEIDVVLEAAITGYPHYPNEDSDAVPRGLQIHTAPTSDMAQSAFKEFCQLYLAAGSGTHTVKELGDAIEKPYPFAWTIAQRLQDVLPETMITVDMREKAVRKRAVTFGNIALAEIKRTMSPEEHKARSTHRHAPNEKAMAKYTYGVEYRKRRTLEDLKRQESEKRRLEGYNHVAITFDDTTMSLDLMTREGRLAFRYLEGLKKMSYFPYEGERRVIAIKELRAKVWEAMTIGERLDYATDFRQLGSSGGTVIDRPLKHIGAAFHTLKPGGEHPVTQPNGYDTILFANPSVRLAFSRKPPAETGALPPLVIPPFPTKIMSLLPKKRLEISDYNSSDSHEQGRGSRP